MACVYYFKGKPYTETQFKKLLNDGLLDQLVFKKDFEVTAFRVNDELIGAISPAKIVNKNVTTRLVRKIATRPNHSKKVENGQVSKLWPQKNVADVINKANKEIEQENTKDSNLNRQPVELILTTNIKGNLKGLSREQAAELDKTAKSIERYQGLESDEGGVYMLVPSPNGLHPIRLRTSFIGETKLRAQAESLLKKISKAQTAKEVEGDITKLQSFFHNIEFQPLANNKVKVLHTKTVEDVKEITSEQTFNNLESLTQYVIGDYTNREYTGPIENNVKVNPGLLVKVDYKQMNKGNYNIQAANNLLFTTDTYTENGNFFNSSNFVIQAIELEGGTEEDLNKILEENAQAIADSLITQMPNFGTEVKNQNTKEDESPFNNMTVKEIGEVLNLKIPLLNVQGVSALVESKVIDNKLQIVNITGSRKLNSKEKETIKKSFWELKAVKDFKNKLAKTQDVTVEKTTKQLSKVVQESANFEIVKDKKGNSYYQHKKSGLRIQRQTDAVNELEGKEVVANEAMKQGGTVGNFIDIIARDIFNGKVLGLDYYKGELQKINSDNNYNLEVSELDFSNLINKITLVKSVLEGKGYTFISDGVFLYQKYNDAAKKKTGFDGVGGTLDLVAISPKGQIEVIDFKGIKFNEQYNEANIYSDEKFPSLVGKWTKQQSIYGALLQEYGLPVVGINILGVNNTYTVDEETRTISIDNFELASENTPVKEGYKTSLSNALIKLKGNKEIIKKLKERFVDQTAEVEPSTEEILQIMEDPNMIPDDIMEEMALDVMSPQAPEIGSEEDKTLDDLTNEIIEKQENPFLNGLKKNNHDTEAGEDLGPKTRLETKIEDARRWDKVKELKWLKDKIGSKLVGKTFETLEELEQYLPQETYEYLLRARKHGKNLHGLFTQSAVFFHTNAYAGTGYHEAFHVIFNLVLNSEQRLQMVKEAMSKFNLDENMTFIEVEEFLADKFMEYVQTNEGTQKSLGKRIGNFFKSLWRSIKLFFNPKGKVSIDELFENIELGVYKNKPRFVNTDLTKIDPSLIRFSERDAAYNNPLKEREAVEYLEYKFFGILNDLRSQDKALKNISDVDLIKKVGKHRIFSKLIARLGGDIMANPDLTADLTELAMIYVNRYDPSTIDEETLTFINPSSLQKGLLRKLRTVHGINIGTGGISATELSTFEELKIDEDVTQEEAEFLEAWQQNYAEINPEDRLSQRLRSVLSRIPKLNSEGNPKRNSFGAVQFHSGKEVFGWLGTTVTDSYDIDTMMEKFANAVDNKPFGEQLYNTIQNDNNLKSDLWNVLGSKTFMKAALIFEKDGDYILTNSNTRTVADIVQGKLIADFLVESNTLFNKYPPGHVKAGSRNFEDINKKILAEKIEELTEVYNNIEAARGAKTNLLTSLNFLEEWLNANNFNISFDTLVKIWNPQRADKGVSWNNVKDVVVKLQRIYKEFENGKNPFLTLKPQEILVKNKTINKDLIVDLATTLKPGLNKEYQASYINAEKKSEYSIRLANHLTKMTAHFKDKKKLTEYLSKVASDPLLDKMPFLQDLIIRDDNGKPKLNSKGEIQLTDNAAEFDVQTFDALSRTGKKRAVPYKDLSDIEMETVNLAFFHNNGIEAFGYYKLPIPSDATSIPYVQMAKLSEEEIVNKLTEIAEGEISRINYLKSKNIELLKLIPNYYKRGQRFQVLSFLNEKIDPTNYTKEELSEVIANYLKGDFFTKEKLKFLKTGVIDKINEDGSIVFAPKLLTKTAAPKGQEFFYNYLINQYYANTQLTTLLSGDPSFYKSTTDYQKRNKQIVSPGELTNAKKKGVAPTYKGVILKDSEVPLKSTVLTSILKIIEDSNLDKATKTELEALWKNKTHNESDAATFISPKRYREILRSLNEWTEAHDKAFERIEDGIESIEDIALFPPLKPFQYTKRYVEGVEVPTQVKNSEMLLTKSFASKYPKLQAIYEAMENGTIDTAIFESAVKVGAVGENLNKKGDIEFSEVIQTEKGLQLSPDANILEFNQEDWKLQNRTPPHYVDDMGNYGTQLRHLMIADLELTDEKKYNGQSGKEIAREYQDLIIENLKESLESVKNVFLKNGEIDYTSIHLLLKQEMESRGLEQDYFDAIELIVDTVKGGFKTKLPLWHPIISYKVQSLLNSIFRNRITKQKINGGNMVNATSYGVSDNLKFKVDEKTGAITMQAIMPWSTRKYFPTDKNGNINLKEIPKELKQIIGYRIPTEDKYSMFNIEVVGFTDPAQGGTIILPPVVTTLAGLDFDIDKLFMMMPEFYVNKKGKPVYIKPISKKETSKELADRVYRDFNLFKRIIKKYASEDYELFMGHRRAVAQANAQNKQIKDALLENPEYVRLEEELKDIKLILTRSTNLKPGEKEAYKKRQEVIEEEKYGLQIYNESLVDERLEIDGESVAGVKQFLEDLIEGRKIPKEELNSRSARNNRLLEIGRTILKNRNTATSILNPGGFDNLKANAAKIRILSTDNIEIQKEGLALIKKYKSGKLDILKYREQIIKLSEELDSEDFNINLPSTQAELFRRNMTGAALIGIFANHNVNHAKAQHTTLTSDPIEIEKDGEVVLYDKLNQILNLDGKRISKSLASLLAAVVDNAKDPIASFLNLNSFTADTVAYMVRLGIDEEFAFALLNQPIIKEITDSYFKERGSLKNQNVIIKNIINKWIERVDKKKLKLSEEEKANLLKQPLSQEQLEEALLDRKSDSYYMVQLRAAEMFKEVRSIATELSELVQATRIDTKGMGATNGSNYVMWTKQQKSRYNNNPKIYGKEDFFIETSNQKLNPAFNILSFIEPMNIMDKIYKSIGTINSDGTAELSGLGLIKDFFGKQKGEFYNLTDAEAFQIDVHFMTYVGSKLPFFDRNQSETILKNIPNRVQKFKKENPDSIYMDFLDQLHVKAADRSSAIKRIEYYTTGKGPQNHEIVRNAWKLMLLDSNPEIKQLALDIIKYTYFAAGYGFGPFSFGHLVPVMFWTDEYANMPGHAGLGLKEGDFTFNQLMEEELLKLENEKLDENSLHADETLRRFIYQFAQNTAGTSLIIPSVSTSEKFERPVKKNISEILNDDAAVHVVGTTQSKNLEAQDRFAASKMEVKFKYFNADNTPMTMTNELMDAVISEFERLVKTAEENPDMDFHLFESAFKTIPFKFWKGRVKQKNGKDGSLKDFGRDGILHQIREKVGLPDNIILPTNYEIRTDSKVIIVDGNLYLKPSRNQELVIDSIRDSVDHLKYAKFVKTGKGKDTKLYVLKEVVDSKQKGLYLMYREIPTLGSSNFVQEYDINNSNLESVVPAVREFQEKEKTDDMAAAILASDMELTADMMNAALESMPEEDLADMMGMPTIDTTKSTIVKPTTQPQAKDDLGLIDPGMIPGALEMATEAELKVPTYEEYKAKANKLKVSVEERVGREEFDAMNPEMKRKHFECL